MAAICAMLLLLLCEFTASGVVRDLQNKSAKLSSKVTAPLGKPEMALNI